MANASPSARKLGKRPATSAPVEPSSPANSASAKPILLAKISDVRALASLLRPIALAAHATVAVEEAGLTFTTEYDRCVQASAFVNAPLFSIFQVNFDAQARAATRDPNNDFTLDTLDDDEDDADDINRYGRKIEFEINLHTFLESIDIFGGAPTIKANSNSSGSGSGSGSGAGASASSSTGAAGHHRNAAAPSHYRRTDRPPADDAANGQGWRRRFGTGFGDAADGRAGGTGGDSGTGPDWHASRPTSMIMRYMGRGTPLIVILDEPDVTTQCSLATFERSLNFEYTFARDTCMAQVIMKSEWLQEAIEVIDSSCTKVTLHFLPKDRGGPTIAGPRPRRMKAKESFKLTADADFGTVEMDFPNEGSNMSLFLCERATVNSYRFAHLHQAIKALQVSMKVSLRTDERGLLCMQFLMPRGTGTESDPTMKVIGTPAGASGRDGHGYIQFMCCPLDEDIDEEDEDDDDDEARGLGAYSMHF
ncbi:checkpoint clamp complex protein Rad1 [Tilletia horrida]|nr:checkpoint clamp complex protein Rad1 [Tilletia horrida]